MNNILKKPLYLNIEEKDIEDFLTPITPNPKIYFNQNNLEKIDNNNSLKKQPEELNNIKENLEIINKNFENEIKYLKNKLKKIKINDIDNFQEENLNNDELENSKKLLEIEENKNNDLKNKLKNKIDSNQNLELNNFMLDIELVRLIKEFKIKGTEFEELKNNNSNINKEINIIKNKLKIKLDNLKSNKKYNNLKLDNMKLDIKIKNKYNINNINDKNNFDLVIFLNKLENKRLRKIYKETVLKKLEYDEIVNNFN